MAIPMLSALRYAWQRFQGPPMDTMQDIFADYARAYESRKESDMSICGIP